MGYNYKFTQWAESDLEKNLSYIEYSLHNPTAAKALYRKTFEAIDVICAFPQSGAEVNNVYYFSEPLRRILIDNYILYYQILDEEKLINIVRFVYGRRNQENILA